MKTKYILTDLDGTLIRSNQTISDYSVKVVTDALNNGHVVSYATARSYISSMDILSDIPWKFPLVLYNGALLYDPVQQRLIDGHFLDTNISNEIIALGEQHNISPFLFFLDAQDEEKVFHKKLSRDCDLKFFNSRPNDPRFNQVNHLVFPEDSKTIIVTFIGTYEELKPIYDKVERTYKDHIHIHFMEDSYITNNYFLEFCHPLANKKKGLELWCDHLGCDKEDVVVFGDNLNDLGMFEGAGRGVAVGNAHDQLKKLANEVIEHHDKDAVAKYINKIV
ncbi:Cof-type HAD-IIB family hydrolase [Chengkuizengella axinellae]|uniref:Cof-type HAD-IIB family hydrolase n=1 Tax=Chengkuizengella axinellae TaxID=3064388 RepID=A0ABT9IUC5_9BACL|nr:Cof-type HAD-IIB family hydrolase [Chengkuizengella sp. 2205SS18-9]MDP5272965.1 Cof-type HAD-IIB family hydrolase [Chengkuizengella sp. 2205SS18-9]